MYFKDLISLGVSVVRIDTKLRTPPSFLINVSSYYSEKPHYLYRFWINTLPTCYDM